MDKLEEGQVVITVSGVNHVLAFDVLALKAIQQKFKEPAAKVIDRILFEQDIVAFDDLMAVVCERHGEKIDFSKITHQAMMHTMLALTKASFGDGSEGQADEKKPMQKPIKKKVTTTS